MASTRLDEVIVDAVIAKLQQFWPDRIGQINAEKDDGIVCAAPDPSAYFVGRMQQVNLMPAVWVLAGPGKFVEQGAHSLVSNYEIQVYLTDQDQTGPQITRRLMRQERAVIEVLYDDPPQESLYVAGSDIVQSAFRIFPARTVPGAVFQPSGQDTWRGTYLIVFQAQQEEM
jgi:hypothetical protein